MGDNTELMLDVGQANELKFAFRRSGWKNSDIKALCEGNTLKGMLDVLRGNARIELNSRVVIDLDQPLLTGINHGGCNWKISKFKKNGQFELDFEKLGLYRIPAQVRGKSMQGYDLYNLLQDEPIVNANLLDFLLRHPHLIPDEWVSKWVYFWGTVYYIKYKDNEGIEKTDYVVRCLTTTVDSNGNKIAHSKCENLVDGWNENEPAVMLVVD